MARRSERRATTYRREPDLVEVTMAHFHTYEGQLLRPGDVVQVPKMLADEWTRAGYVQTIFPEPDAEADDAGDVDDDKPEDGAEPATEE